MDREDDESTEYEEDENTAEEELKIVLDDQGGAPMLSLDIPEGTLSTSATFNQPLPLTLCPDGRLRMETITSVQKRMFVVVQKVEVETHSKRCKTSISNSKRAHTRILKSREEILALRSTIKKLERRIQEMEAEREGIPPFIEELVQVSKKNKLAPYKYSMDFKFFCTQLYTRSHAAYKILAKTLHFPSPKTVEDLILLEKLSRPKDWTPPEVPPRVRFQPHQLEFLETEFEQVKIPSKEKVKELAKHLQVKEFKVYKWFEKRRAALKAEEDDLKRQILRGEMHQPSCPQMSQPEPEQSKEKLPRYVMRKGQLTILTKWYERNAIPSKEDFELIAGEACLDIRRCLKWFENRRHKDARDGRRSTGDATSLSDAPSPAINTENPPTLWSL